MNVYRIMIEQFTDTCPQQIITNSIGRMHWNVTNVNETAFVVCPYGPHDERVGRKCQWDTVEGRPVWMQPAADDESNCRQRVHN